MRTLSIATALLVAMTASGPAPAQDYLGAHLDTMLEHNLRQHQQQHAHDGPAAEQPRKRSKSGTMSPAAEARARAEGARIMERHRRELEPRYRMRIERDGKAEADAWLATESRRMGIQTGRQMREKYSGQ